VAASGYSRSRAWSRTHITETFFTLMPTLEEAARLQLPAGEPVMILERETYAKDDQLVEFARGVHAAGLCWVYTFAVPD
jgi:GntR family transcriptional regulator